jgi:methionyl-tRNA synthetase
MTQRFYVTTPIYYVNGSPHIGHAYTSVVADALTRYHRLRGQRARFLTGTDEHGQKIEREAVKAGMAPQAFVDDVSQRFRGLWPKLGVQPDDFIRTTEARHVAGVQKWWRKVRDAGDLYKGSYKGLYCIACEGYKTEKELLPGNLCPIHERPVETREEETWLFRLSKYQDRLLKLYEEHPEFVLPETRRNEIVSFVQGGLDDLSVSRSNFTWGIPVPDDPGHVIYVWFDALFNYLTAVDETPERDFWPPQIQLVAKDIVRFHTVYWPAFLMSAGFTRAQLPTTVWTHGYLLTGGRKTSKTPGLTAVKTSGTTDPVRIADVLGADVLRFYLLREVSFGQDGEFSIPGIIGRARAELGETVGNLLHRALPFVGKYFDGRVPEVKDADLTDLERTLRARVATLVAEAGAAWDALTMSRALELTIETARTANRYFDETAPWKLAKSDDRARLGVVIAHVLEIVRIVAVMLSPVTPTKSDDLLHQLGLGALTPREDVDQWPSQWGELLVNTVVRPGPPVFPKYDPPTEAAMLLSLDVRDAEPATEKTAPKTTQKAPMSTDEKPATETAAAVTVTATATATVAAPVTAPAASPAAEEPSPAIAYDDFAKVDLRVGKVLTAEKIPRKDRLLKLSVDLGEASGPRTIIAGIALAFPVVEELVGQQVVVVANLAPRDFGKGLVSHGMLLAASSPESLSLATFAKPYPVGTRVK